MASTVNGRSLSRGLGVRKRDQQFSRAACRRHNFAPDGRPFDDGFARNAQALASCGTSQRTICGRFLLAELKTVTEWHQRKFLIIAALFVLSAAAMIYVASDRDSVLADFIRFQFPFLIAIYAPAMLASSRQRWLWPVVLLCARSKRGKRIKMPT